MKPVGLLLLGVIGLGGCGAQSAIYGVPASRWNQMSEAERAAARQDWERQQALREQTREADERAAEQTRRKADAAREQAEEACRDPALDSPNRDACEQRTRHRTL